MAIKCFIQNIEKFKNNPATDFKPHIISINENVF